MVLCAGSPGRLTQRGNGREIAPRRAARWSRRDCQPPGSPLSCVAQAPLLGALKEKGSWWSCQQLACTQPGVLGLCCRAHWGCQRAQGFLSSAEGPASQVPRQHCHSRLAFSHLHWNVVSHHRSSLYFEVAVHISGGASHGRWNTPANGFGAACWAQEGDILGSEPVRALLSWPGLCSRALARTRGQPPVLRSLDGSPATPHRCSRGSWDPLGAASPPGFISDEVTPELHQRPQRRE